MENLETALLLMLVGMSTVFVILFLVIGLGKGLIALVNTYAPAETAGGKPTLASVAVTVSSSSPTEAETAAIVAAVGAITVGQGKVTRIEKI